MPVQILDRWDGSVLYESTEAGTVRDALLEAFRKGANLRSADLRSANLYGADLYGADLRSANLRSANLYGADLYGADLRSANLYGADLRSADLYGADLRSANLRSADLRSADLRSANLYGADLYGADLRSADLYGADLRSANLRSADLRSADLRSANLYGADLYGADLRSANLRSANLYGANGLNKYMTSPLYMLLDQPGKIRAYKLVTPELTGPHYPGITYTIGSVIECEADPDETLSCSHGINIATLDWVIREWSEGMRILIVEHEAQDIACIPLGTDGKYRVSKCEVVGEKDLKSIGLVREEATEESAVSA